MARRMACTLTIDAVRQRRKTVTRRHVDTWRSLAPGDRLTLVEKGMGLARGDRQVVLAEVGVVNIRVEPIGLLTADVRYGRQEVRLEGLDSMTPDEFVAFWCSTLRAPTDSLDRAATLCRRIEWQYLDVTE